MTQQGLVIMTALVPTIGHQYLVEMAANVMDAVGGYLQVIVFVREREPVRGRERITAFRDQFAHMPHINFHVHLDNNAPQNDDGTQKFWDYWCNLAYKVTNVDKFDFVFASEAYGSIYADQLGAEFIPCDIDREIFNVKGTTVRHNIVDQFENILPAFRKYMARRITLFGAESTGKTTMARRLAKESPWGNTYLPEWARPYLERFGPVVTDQRMGNITLAQYASQQAVMRSIRKPAVFQDTDLLSTIGYYNIYGGTQLHDIVDLFWLVGRSDLYIVMNSDIPFEQDPLRYGGVVRETNDEFWTKLLDQFACKYHVVKATDHEEQFKEISQVVEDFFELTYKPIVEFQRD